MTDDASIEEALLPLEAVLRQVRGPPAPYFYELEHDGRLLICCGLRHSRDPEEEGLRELERRWESFIARRGEAEAIGLVEGRVREVAADRRAAIVDQGGEGGLLALLAHRAGVPVRCPEPSWPELLAAQTERFDADRVCHAYYLRALALWHHAGQPADRDSYIAGVTPLSALGCELDAEAVQMRHHRHFRQSLDLNDVPRLRSFIDPGARTSPLAAVMERDAQLRDVHVVKAITDELGAGRHVFVVYGVFHVMMQEPAVRQILGSDLGVRTVTL